MLKSMTGYGLSKAQKGAMQVSVEIRSLNSKFLDAQIRLPRHLQDKELEIRNMLNSELVRGKVAVSIEMSSDDTEASKQEVNHALFKSYYNEYDRLASDVGAEKADLFRLALHSPEVMSGSGINEDLVEQQWQFTKENLIAAIVHCNEFREQEGAKLQAELESYIKNIGDYLNEIKGVEGERLVSIRERIEGHQKDLVGSDQFDVNRFEQEMIYFIEKLDVSEEFVRLNAHLDYFLEILKETNSQGKKLNFISQEIGREINTIGSKANYAPMQRSVVCMKDELEKIKEQLLNII
ncbi:YicC/YloC family endoribonuclease [Roseivirga echinicomitans]